MLIEISPLLALLSIVLAGYCGTSSLSRPMTAEERKLFDRMTTDHPDWDWRLGVDAVNDVGFEMRRLENEAESCVGTEEDRAKRKEKFEKFRSALNEYVNAEKKAEPAAKIASPEEQQKLRARVENLNQAYAKDGEPTLERKKQLLAEYGAAADAVWESYGVKIEK